MNLWNEWKKTVSKRQILWPTRIREFWKNHKQVDWPKGTLVGAENTTEPLAWIWWWEYLDVQTHQVDGDDEVVLLVSLPFLCLLPSFDWCGFRLSLHLPLLSRWWFLNRFLRCFCLATLLAGHWCLLACLSLLVDVATSISRLISGLKWDQYNGLRHVFVNKMAGAKYMTWRPDRCL